MKKKGVVITSLALGLAVVGTLVWFVVSGKISVTLNFGQPQAKIGSGSICGSNDVKLFNQQTEYKPRGEDNKITIDSAGLTTLSNEIKKRSNYELDPTCQTILFWQANYAVDGASATKAYNALNDLHAKGLFADNNINLIRPLDSYKQVVDRLNSSNPLGGGN